MNVLVAEDDPVTLRLLEASLKKWGYEVISARTGTEAQQALLAGKARLAILDWMLPEISGPDLCRSLRRPEGGRYIYVIILSARDSKDDLVEGLRAGADDYLTKPFDREELELRVRVGQRLLDLQQDLLDAQDQLTEMATHDGLTGLRNHQAILEDVEREFARHLREKNEMAVVMADLDRFKLVNDTHGHPAGDTVLAEVAARMADIIRQYDCLGRYGGEEFLTVLPGCDGESAFKIAQRMHLAVSDRSFATGSGPVGLTASMGVASTSDVSVASASELVKAADEALYQAKREGRNCVVRAAPQAPPAGT